MMKTTTLFTLLSFSLWSACALGQAKESVSVIEGPGSTLSQAPRPSKVRAPRLPYGLELMAHFELLPLLRDTKCVQDSSYDRSGGNGDAGHFLRKEGNKAIL